MLNQLFVCTKGDVFHTKIVYTIVVWLATALLQAKVPYNLGFVGKIWEDVRLPECQLSPAESAACSSTILAAECLNLWKPDASFLRGISNPGSQHFEEFSCCLKAGRALQCKRTARAGAPKTGCRRQTDAYQNSPDSGVRSHKTESDHNGEKRSRTKSRIANFLRMCSTECSRRLRRSSLPMARQTRRENRW